MKKIKLIVLLGVLALHLNVMAQTAPLICSIDRPTAETGATVALRVWVGEQATLAWSATAGTLKASGRLARWQLPARTGLHKVTLRSTSQDGPSRQCKLRVIVVGENRGSRETGHAFLIRGTAEPRGYGLYS